MLVYWKKYEKVEKEHRKKAEKEAIEQRKIDFEMNEVCIAIEINFIFKQPKVKSRSSTNSRQKSLRSKRRMLFYRFSKVLLLNLTLLSF